MVRKAMFTLGAGFLLALVIALPAGALPASAGHHPRHWQSQRQALYVQTDNTTANSIMVYDRGWNGTLHFAGSYATGGKGGQAAGSAVDPLASQGSLTTAANGQVLLAVNAGSDSVSLFSIAGGDKPLLKQVIASRRHLPGEHRRARRPRLRAERRGRGRRELGAGLLPLRQPSHHDPRLDSARSARPTPPIPSSSLRRGWSASAPTVRA